MEEAAAPEVAEAESLTGRELSDEAIINPEREIRLSNGKSVVVEPWGMKKSKLVLARLDALGPAFREQTEVGWDPRKLLVAAWDEVVDLVAITVNVEREEMEREPHDRGWTFEDILSVTEAVLEVCVLRADGRGALPLLSALIGRMTEITVRTLGPALARQHAEDLQRADISKGESGNGSA